MNIRIAELSNYAKPEIVESKHDDWVAYGEDNDYFEYLIERYYGSPTNNAIINSISEMIYGEGLKATDSDKDPEGWAKVIKLFPEDDLRQVIIDYKVAGNAVIQLVRGKSGKFEKAYHAPIDKFRSGKCDENGDVKKYYYSTDWQEVERSISKKPKEYPAYGHEKPTDKVAIYWIKNYSIGTYYYSPVDYQGGLQYAQLEEEVANYHNNNVKNGLAPSMLINFNDGVPPEEEQNLMERKINDKYSGSSNAGRAIIAFNNSADTAATIEPVQLSDADKQYEFLSSECMKKLMVAHRVTSPMLMGIKDNTGLGNNAEEIKTASQLFDNTVIRPKQQQIIKCLKRIINNELDVDFDLYFKTIQPIEFSDTSGMNDEAEIEKETGEELSKDQCCVNLSKEEVVIDNLLADELISKGEEIDEEEWELVDAGEVDYDLEEKIDEEIKELEEEFKPNESLLSKITNLVSTGSAKPDQSSNQDAGIFKVRYRYRPIRRSSGSRQFCKRMESADKLYRKEDIKAMASKAVNAGFGPNGANTYDVWLYKGGKYCHHFWQRETYMRKRDSKGRILPNKGLNNDKEVSVNEARRKGFTPPNNNRKVAQRPIDMPKGGAL